MSNKIYGDLDIYGVVTVGSKTDGSSGAYTLPFRIGNNGYILAISPAPSSTGISGSMAQWVDPTASPFNFVTNDYLNSLTNTTSSATLCAANQFTLDHINDVSVNVNISGQNGITVSEVSANQFIISLDSNTSKIYGYVNCDTSNYVYIVNNSRIGSNAVVNLTLNLPVYNAVLYQCAVAEVISGSFKIILGDTPDVTGYKVNWTVENPV